MTEEKKKILKDFWKAFGTIILITIAVIVVAVALLWHFYSRAAVVNGSSISRLTVIQELESESGESMLDALVTKKLIAQKAAEAGIKVEEAEVDETIKTLEEQIAAQGSTLDIALSQQGITLEKFREQVTLQKALEKLLADKVSVTDEEITQYIESTQMGAPEGMSEEDFKEQVREQLVGQKLGVAAQEWITEQKNNASIQYYVPYAPEPVTEEMMPENMEAAPAPEATEQQSTQPAN